MKIGRFSQAALWFAAVTCAAASLTTLAFADEGDVAAGAMLYVSQCKICHGSASALDKDQAAPALPNWAVARLAMRHGVPESLSDAAPVAAQGTGGTAGQSERLAFAPPFGPLLTGVYMRPAGTIADFQYSATFIATLKGMPWNDAALDVWITDPQAWVPGVYMYYKQRDAEARRKIIEYLKSAR